MVRLMDERRSAIGRAAADVCRKRRRAFSRNRCAFLSLGSASQPSAAAARISSRTSAGPRHGRLASSRQRRWAHRPRPACFSERPSPGARHRRCNIIFSTKNAGSEPHPVCWKSTLHGVVFYFLIPGLRSSTLVFSRRLMLRIWKQAAFLRRSRIIR